MDPDAYQRMVERHMAQIREREWAVLAPLLTARAPGDLLEVGCRHAKWLRLAAAMGYRAVGLDPFPEQGAPGDPVILRGTAENIPLPDRSQDVVLVSNCICVFQDRAKAMAEIARVLRKDGRVFILTSNALMAFIQLLTKYGLVSPRLLLRALRERSGRHLREALWPKPLSPECSSIWGELRVWRTSHWRAVMETHLRVTAVHRTAFFTFPEYRFFVVPRKLGTISSSVVLEGRLP